MRVFISWSGRKSRALAEALREWIPFVLPAAEPWMSATDIDRGARWSVEVASQLDSANVGIICLTPENIEAPWILFEAGALSKILSKALVCTYLFQLKPADIKGPLAQFQATLAEKSETRRLVVSMNKVLGASTLPEARLEKMFEQWWPEFQKSLQSIAQQKEEQVGAHRSDRDLVEEILALQRRSDPRTLAPELAKHILKLLSANGFLEGQTSGPSAARRIASEDATLIVDTTPLLGRKGRKLRMHYPVFGTVSDFLDELYYYVSDAVPAGTFGRLWALRDPATGELYKEMGRSWAKGHENREADSRPLQEMGIKSGMVLEAVRLDQVHQS